ncbi:MAG: FdhF/YdeP family oxidoreductase [Candidatus Cyclobacteriaceae bacterium M2_1C_046]
MTKKKEGLHAQPPEEHGKYKIKDPKKGAGGMGAVTYAMRHVYGQVGVIKGTKALLGLNQFKGYDCPGCAWPDPDDERAVVEFCENGAKAVAEEATKEKVDADFFRKHSVQEISSWSDYKIGKSGRIFEPVILREGSDHYEPLAWGEAFSIIGKNLNSLPSPDNAIFYTSGRTSNEAAFLYQLFVRQYGTNNLPDCSNMCHESSGSALTETVGIGKGSVKLEDFYEAEVIFIIGQNPGTNHPRMLTALQIAKKKGATIITANPLKEAGLLNFKHPQKPADVLGKGTSLTDLYLQVRINSDVALLLAINKILLQKEMEQGGVLDHDFITSKTSGYKEYKETLGSYDLEDLIRQTGIPAGEIHKAADIIAAKKKIIVCWAMGLTQHKNAVDNIREIVNMLLLKGSIGKPGAGTCPVRGHSNVQGDRTMGIWEIANPAFIQKLEEVFEFDAPKHNGYDTVHAIEAMANKKANVFIAMGGNFLSATPDTEYTAKALQNCYLTVHISTKLNRSHVIHGKTSIILPCLGRTEKDMQKEGEQFVSVENSTGVVHTSQGNKKPVSPHLKSEPKIVAGIANATLPNSTVDWEGITDNYDRIRDLIEKVIPGFEDYNRRVRKPAGFYLPNGARIGDFNTDIGKALFTVNKLPDYQLQEDEYLMMTIRSHDQFNTTIYGMDDRYRGLYNERRVVFMNPADMKRANLQQEDIVDLVSNYKGVERIAKNFLIVSYDIPTKNVATYFPEANVLVPWDYYADKSHTPVSKSIIIRIIKRK